MPNRLQFESSPYLLQHANNPVDWYPWGAEALNLAKEKNLPILLSIGYATCHWCHVMEKESFEDEQVASFMNMHFINIKLDREERPDLDQLFMTACISINGSGGWPLNCFLLPDGRPFYANTYFPPKPAHGRPSWIQLLANVYQTFSNTPDVILNQAEKLTEIIRDSSKISISDNIAPAADTSAKPFDFASLENAFYRLRERFDTINGGFGAAPKFPGTLPLAFLLRYGIQFENKEAIAHVKHSLLALCRGGIYDHLKGGWARYTVDAAWMIPHFEKMLYDNGLIMEIIANYLKHYEDTELKTAWLQTFDWLTDEMKSKELFFSALDADSEGVEGKFYIWDTKELKLLLTNEEYEKYKVIYNIEEEGNWEEKNILYRTSSWPELEHKLQTENLKSWSENINHRLLKERDKRIRPITDDKQICSWNALCLIGILAGKEMLDSSQKETVRQWLATMENNFVEGDTLYRLYKNGERKQAGFLEDYAYWINALIEAYQVYWDLEYLRKAKYWMEQSIAAFGDEEHPLFYFSAVQQKDILIRSKQHDDGALPSANGMMCKALHYLGIIFHKPDWTAMALAMLENVKVQAEKYPSSMGHWMELATKFYEDCAEIAIVGPNAENLYADLTQKTKLTSIIMVNDRDASEFPLLKDRLVEGDTYIYICKQYACHKPVQTIGEAMQLLSDI